MVSANYWVLDDLDLSVRGSSDTIGYRTNLYMTQVGLDLVGLGYRLSGTLPPLRSKTGHKKSLYRGEQYVGTGENDRETWTPIAITRSYFTYDLRKRETKRNVIDFAEKRRGRSYLLVPLTTSCVTCAGDPWPQP